MYNNLKKELKEKLAELRRKYQKYVQPYISLVIVVLFLVAIISSYKISREYYRYVAEVERESVEADNGTNDSYVVAKALENTAVSLTGDAILSIDDVDELQENGRSAGFWFWAYLVSRIIFPAVCLIFIVGIVKKMFRYSLIWVPHPFKTEIAIFGYSNRVGEVIDHSNMDDYKVYMVLNEKLDDEVEEKLFRNGISIIYEPLEKKEYYKYRTLRKCKYFLFMEEDSMKNVAIYMSFCQDVKNNHIVDRKKTKFYIQCNDVSTEKLLKKYSDKICGIIKAEKKKEEEEKVDESITDEMKQEAGMFISNVELFSYMDLLAQKTFSKLPLYQYYINSKDPGTEKKDTHLFLAGFSEFGEAMFYHAIMLGIFGSDTEILIDIVDHNAEETKRKVLNVLAEFKEKSDGKGSSETGNSGSNAKRNPSWEFVMDADTVIKLTDKKEVRLADGSIRVRVWEAEVLSDDYSEVLEEICNNKSVTYAASCFNSSELNMRCVDRLSDILQRMDEPKRIPLAVNLQNAKGLKDVLEDEKKEYYCFSNVHFTMSDENDLGLDQIISVERNEMGAYYSSMYNMFYGDVGLNEIDDAEVNRAWESEKLYYRQSTLEQVNAAEVQKYIVQTTRYINGQDAVVKLQEFVRKLSEVAEMDFSEDVKEELRRKTEEKETKTEEEKKKAEEEKKKAEEEMRKAATEKVKDEMQHFITTKDARTALNDIIEEWAKIEHRRWCYYMLLTGHHLVEKRDERKIFERDIIMSWEDIGMEGPLSEKKKLDLIPFLMIAKGADKDNKISYHDANKVEDETAQKNRINCNSRITIVK